MDRSVKSERKTRSMRLKENSEEIPKSLIKKGNYVRNPELVTNNEVDEDVPKSTRKLRRHTLKEQNRLISDDDVPVKKHKQSSRTKKNHVETADNLNIGDQLIEMPEVKQKVKKSKKKKQESVEEMENIEEIKDVEDVPKTKKKSKKRKTSKQSSEQGCVKIEDNNGMKDILNVSNASNESYHSAAGSITNEIITKLNTTITELETVPDVSNKKLTPKSLKKKSNIIFDCEVKDEIGKSFKNEPLKCGSRNSEILNKSMEINENMSNVKLDDTKEKLKSIEKNNSIMQLNDTYEKSNSDEKNNSKIKLDDTYEKLKSDEKNSSKIKLDDTYEKPKSAEKNSLKIKLDDTYEKLKSAEKNSSKIKLDDTYEKLKSDEKNSSKIKLDDTSEKLKSAEKNSSKIKLDDTYEKLKPAEKNSSKIKLDDTYEKPKSAENNTSKIKLDDTYEKPKSAEKNSSKIKFNDTYEKLKSAEKNSSKIILDDTYEKPKSAEKNSSKIKLDDTYEKSNSDEKNNSKIDIDDTYEKPKSAEKNSSKIILDDTYEKPKSAEKNSSKIKLDDEKLKSAEKNSSKLKHDDTYKKSNLSITIENNESMNKRRSSSILLLDASNSMTDLNNTFNNSDKPNNKSLDATIEKEYLNTTYDYEKRKSDNNSHISINSEDSKTENLLNMTPELIESSNDEISFKNSPKSQNLELPVTPFKREGTYIKESPPYIGKESPLSKDPENSTNEDRTPERPKSLQSPGHTPFVSNKKTVLNVTHSLEKLRRSESMEPVPRATKVMFCSPTNQATVSSQIKRKVIKSNMKGSNKSFIFDSSVSELNRSGRKRSYTQNDAEEVRSKRSKLEEKKSVERLSRPRTLSATVKTSETLTPSKKPTKTKPDKVTRTKLPNFTALHQKQFDKMESLDQCQERKARRARQLLTPTGTANLLDRISPKEKDTDSPSIVPKEKPKPSTPLRKSKAMTLASLNPGYTRFGFKMNTSVNPFSVPKEDKPNDSKLLPSRTGATTSRREAAKQTVMREKSFTERNSTKRNESRTFIKGVRTNRRFQLQMEMRNVNIN